MSDLGMIVGHIQLQNDSEISVEWTMASSMVDILLLQYHVVVSNLVSLHPGEDEDVQFDECFQKNSGVVLPKKQFFLFF